MQGMAQSGAGRGLLMVLCLGLAIGGVFHIYNNLVFGWLPHGLAPLWINGYWSALAILDPLAVFLLMKARRLGLALALLIMFSDVVISSYAFYFLDASGSPMVLQLQAVFLGFVIAASISLWKQR